MTKRSDVRRIAVGVEALARPQVTRDTAAEERLKKDKRPWLYRVRVAMQTSPEKSAKAARMRMMFPIMGFVGPNGGGKTACAVSMALTAMRSGRPVLSTAPLLDPATGEPHPLYVPWTDWDQLLTWRDGDVLADEIMSIAGARESSSLDVRAQTTLVQLRKKNARFWWTAPSLKRADVIIREVSQAVTECRGFYAGRQSTMGTAVIQSWAPKRLFTFRTYDMIEFDDWTAGRRDKAEPMVSEWFHGVGSDVFKAYETLGSVNVIAGVGDGGLCDTCGGTITKRRRRCTCDHPTPAVSFEPARAETTDVDAGLGHVAHEHEFAGA